MSELGCIVLGLQCKKFPIVWVLQCSRLTQEMMFLEDLSLLSPFSCLHYRCHIWFFLLFFFFYIECWQAWALVNEANLGDLLTSTSGMCILIAFICCVASISFVLLTRSSFPGFEMNKIDLRSPLALQTEKKINRGILLPQIVKKNLDVSCACYLHALWKLHGRF